MYVFLVSLSHSSSIDRIWMLKFRLNKYHNFSSSSGWMVCDVCVFFSYSQWHSLILAHANMCKWFVCSLSLFFLVLCLTHSTLPHANLNVLTEHTVNTDYACIRMAIHYSYNFNVLYSLVRLSRSLRDYILFLMQWVKSASVFVSVSFLFVFLLEFDCYYQLGCRFEMCSYG